MRDKQIPLGFVLVDDGWLSVRNDKLTAFNADAQKFPHDLSGLARALREQYRIPHVGVWHTFQGYWSGVEADSEIGRAHQLFQGLGGKALPDPRDGRGESFYRDWYSRLKEWGYDFVKVDGQGNNIKFTDGLMPLFASGGGTHHPGLMAALGRRLGELPGGHPLRRFDDLFFTGDAKEAVAFALLGYLTLHGQPGNVVAATGAAGPRGRRAGRGWRP